MENIYTSALCSEFEKKHEGYKIKWIDIPIKEAQKRTLASILSSTPPDLINLNPDFSALFLPVLLFVHEVPLPAVPK